MIETREKLLNAAEKLFAAEGYNAISLRQIIAEADVNVAAVHYHFGSKEELVDQVVMRRAGPVNEERIARLDRIEAESGECPPNLERIFEAFLAPIEAVAAKHPEFARMMGRLQLEGILSGVIARTFQPMFARFIGLLRKAAPGLGDAEFRWRVHFAQGALSYAMCGGVSPLGGALEDEGLPVRIERLIVFLGGAFAAPPIRAEKPVEPNGRKQ